MLIRHAIVVTTASLFAGAVAPAMATAQLGVQPERNAPATYAITNARIVPVTGPALERGTIVIRDGIITAVGARVAVPADARTIEGSGLTVYPGFIEAFGSLGMPATSGQGGARGGPPATGAPPRAPAPAAGAPNSLRPVGQQPELLALDLLRPDADDIAAAQGAGFTAALTAPGSGIFAGQSAMISVRDGAAQEILVQSPVALHVGFSSGRGFGGGYPTSVMGVFAVLRQTLLDAQHYGAETAAYAANPRGRTRPAYDASLAALQPVLARRVPVVMTANTQREIERALDLAREFNLRAVIAGGQEAHLVATRLKAEDVPVLLSVDFPRAPGTRSPDADPEPLRVLRDRVEAPRSPALLADAGVRVALQSGGGYGRFLENVQRAVESGLSRDQAIRALTLAPAQILGVADRVGSIETGKVANLTLVRGDAFARGARVAQLFVDGQPVEVRAAGTGGDRSADAAIAGTWTVTVTLDGSERPVTLGLQQTGNQLRGTLQGALGTTRIGTGTVGADGEFRFTASVTLPDGTEEATFSGTLTGNAMRGTVTIVGHDPGTFVGTRPSAGPGAQSPARPRQR